MNTTPVENIEQGIGGALPGNPFPIQAGAAFIPIWRGGGCSLPEAMVLMPGLQAMKV